MVVQAMDTMLMANDEGRKPHGVELMYKEVDRTGYMQALPAKEPQGSGIITLAGGANHQNDD